MPGGTCPEAGHGSATIRHTGGLERYPVLTPQLFRVYRACIRMRRQAHRPPPLWLLMKGVFAKVTDRVPSSGLEAQDIATGAEIFWNLTTAPLVEHAVRRGEGLLAKDGPLVVRTGKHTGRSAQDKFTVKDEMTSDVIWWNNGNKPMDPEAFDRLHDDFLMALGGKEQLYVADLYGGSQPEHRVRVRVINELAWHNLFIRTLLVRPEASELAGFEPEYTIIDLPTFRADPERHGSRTETVVAVNFSKKLILIGGTSYAGEMKKSVFGLLNFILPQRGIMPMHCSANIGPEGDTAIFFGLSGTGKTTLSADPNRTLIGDDEHGWSDTAVFNFEGGCYAKMIRLSADSEPEIYATTKRFGTVLENVRSEEHTSELQLHVNLVCRLLLEKKKKIYNRANLRFHIPITIRTLTIYYIFALAAYLMSSYVYILIDTI